MPGSSSGFLRGSFARFSRMTEAARPSPSPLGLLSPTMANELFECPMRVAWHLDQRASWLRRPGPSAALGTAAHAMAERLSRGLVAGAIDARQARTMASEAWDDLIDRQEAALTRAWAPAVPPPPQDWPGYQLVRTRVLRHAEEVATSSSPTEALAPMVEEALEDLAVGIAGRPDRVEGLLGDLCVVDLKTGLHQAEPTPAQRRQLLLYAELVRATMGELPRRMGIEDGLGRRWESEVDPRELEMLLADIVTRRQAYERAVASGSLDELADANGETCKWCPYRVICASYWSALRTDWSHGSVSGTAARVEERAGSVLLDVETTSPTDDAGQHWQVSGLRGRTVSVGDRVSIVDGALTRSPRHLRARWSTVLVVGAEPR